MQKSYDAKAGRVELEGTVEFHNEDFGYTLFENVIDPENPDGPSAIAMHVPEKSLSKVWQLVEPDYRERIELLSGTANLVVNRAGTEDWTTMFLTPENPTADDVVIECGDMFCIVTEDQEAVVLSRPSKAFDISFETGVTKSPKDPLSQFLIKHAESKTDKPTTEIERKFLIDSLPEEIDLSNLEGKKIDQGYLAVDERSAVRVRRKGNKCFITFKGSPTGHSAERIELETEITEEQFEVLWPGTEGRRVKKTRYEIPFNGSVIELDIFEGENRGKILAEVEFNSTSDADDFEPPEWLGTDVTADKRFGNSSIADHGFPE